MAERLAAARRAEGVVVAVALPPPVVETDRQLDRRFGFAQELRFVEPQHRVDVLDRRDGRLADADDADFLRLDQFDLDRRAQHAPEQRRGHPARGATAHDHDFPNLL
ncbi:MAG: hypothetical protein MUE63_07165 [Xanthomonadales bacterium]|nr:hypothetical protein [Xanthomonadales bacterium]